MNFFRLLSSIIARRESTSPRPFQTIIEPLESRFAPANFSVISTADSGAGSLRAAIEAANAAPGADTISFSILNGGGVQTIHLTSALPAITEAVTIDGYTQPGSVEDLESSNLAQDAVLQIELDGSAAGTGSHGLHLLDGASTIRGLAINRFDGDGIRIDSGADGSTVSGSFIGTTANGTVALPNRGNGITVIATVGTVTGVTIGGTPPGAANVISGNLGYGVSLGAGTVGATISNNYIGTDASGAGSLGNATGGVLVHGGARDNLIGSAVGFVNIISGNSGNGVTITGAGSTGNVLIGNFIGTNHTGTSSLGNARNGVAVLAGATGNTIGGTSFAEGNGIAYNGGAGVLVDPFAASTAIVGNFIRENGGLGIDLDRTPSATGDGFTTNDLNDTDSGGNGLQNFPVITGAFSTPGGTLLQGTFDSTPNTTFRFEFFIAFKLEPSGAAEGHTLRHFLTVNTDANGKATYSTVVPTQFLPEGSLVTATATPVIGAFQGTSEFAIAARVGPATKVSVSDGTVIEGTGSVAKLAFSVSLDQPAVASTTVSFTTEDFTATGRSALAGTDYESLFGTLTFAAGEQVKIIEVNVSGDTLTEGRESFRLLLTKATGARLDRFEATGTILDNDNHLVATGSANTSLVRLFDSTSGNLLTSFNAFGDRLRSGVRVAMGDVNGDGVEDIIAGSGPGLRGGARVRVFDGANPAHPQIPGALGDFTPFGPGYFGGVYVAAGDVNGDGRADVIVSPSNGSSGEVRVFSGLDGSQIAKFPTLPRVNGGVRIAAGDVDGDGFADVIVGDGLLSSVQVFNGLTGKPLPGMTFTAFGKGYRGGVFLSAGDVNGDGKDDIIVGAGLRSTKILIFTNGSASAPLEVLANERSGVRVGTSDFNGDGRADLLLARSAGGNDLVRVMDVATRSTFDLKGYKPGGTVGVFVS